MDGAVVREFVESVHQPKEASMYRRDYLFVVAQKINPIIAPLGVTQLDGYFPRSGVAPTAHNYPFDDRATNR
ncbi:hypothetical protein [Mucilaginibacter pedocola]|uniref:hypothetical protein n=1 Tax=Mucilaginibacter pedocola TaxID=1792845 RepID=UPI00117E0FEC|nr:hypothetical protein [Mucilaginibacter pedocola]